MIAQVGTLMYDNVELAVYLSTNGGLFAIDASYIEQEAEPCFDCFTGEEIEPD